MSTAGRGRAEFNREDRSRTARSRHASRPGFNPVSSEVRVLTGIRRIAARAVMSMYDPVAASGIRGPVHVAPHGCRLLNAVGRYRDGRGCALDRRPASAAPASRRLPDHQRALPANDVGGVPDVRARWRLPDAAGSIRNSGAVAGRRPGSSGRPTAEPSATPPSRVSAGAAPEVAPRAVQQTAILTAGSVPGGAHGGARLLDSSLIVEPLAVERHGVFAREVPPKPQHVRARQGRQLSPNARRTQRLVGKVERSLR